MTYMDVELSYRPATITRGEIFRHHLQRQHRCYLWQGRGGSFMGQTMNIIQAHHERAGRYRHHCRL